MTEKAATQSGTAASFSGEPPRIVEAVAYLNQCCAAERSFAVLTGDEADIRGVLQCFTAGLPPQSRFARTTAPTDSPHGFLESVLTQFGIEPFDASADDLLRLLTVVVRQNAGPGASTVIIVTDAQDYGPRVFETIREFARNNREFSSPPLLILTGHAGLHRVLDSPGMASVADLTRARFDLDKAGIRTAPPASATAGDVRESDDLHGIELVVSHNHREIDRFSIQQERLLIGRSEHCDVRIESRYVSRQHALLLREGSGHWIIDLNSTNGTIVNSELTLERRLKHGDIISIGNHRLRYINAAEGGSSTAVPAEDRMGETLVMRSLQGINDPDEAFEQSDEPLENTSSAA